MMNFMESEPGQSPNCTIKNLHLISSEEGEVQKSIYREQTVFLLFFLDCWHSKGDA